MKLVDSLELIGVISRDATSQDFTSTVELIEKGLANRFY